MFSYYHPVQAGSYHSLLVDVNGNFLSFGQNDFAQLGTDPTSFSLVNKPVINKEVDNVKVLYSTETQSIVRTHKDEFYICGKCPIFEEQTCRLKLLEFSGFQMDFVACTDFELMATDIEGNVWASGVNCNFGQLGLGGGKRFVTIPQKIENLKKIEYIALGDSHSVFLQNTGQVWTCGFNGYGQLGLSDNVNRNIPELVENLPNIQLVSCGANHTLLLDYKGKVYSFGCNGTCELGHGDLVNRNTPTVIEKLPVIKFINCSKSCSYFIDLAGKVWSCGMNFDTHINPPLEPWTISRLPEIIFISCSKSHSLLLDVNGEVWSRGDNYFGQLGRGGNPKVYHKIVGVPPVPIGDIHCVKSARNF